MYFDLGFVLQIILEMVEVLIYENLGVLKIQCWRLSFCLNHVIPTEKQ